LPPGEGDPFATFASVEALTVSWSTWARQRGP
jgi:hypothetical protein